MKSADRTTGDLARDRGDWAAAAAYYRRHLERAPLDVAIWVQLGHALKESGAADAGRSAYEEAANLVPSDPDALLSLGQAHRILGDTPAAIDCFQRAAASSGDIRALTELEREGVPADIVRATTSQRERAAVLQALQHASVGLRPTRVSDLRLGGEYLELLSHDPWAQFEIGADVTAPLALLEIEGSSVPEHGTLSSQIYVDQGVGYEEHQSARFAGQQACVRIIMVAPTALRSIRWDPDRRVGHMCIPRLSLTNISTVAELDAVLDQMAPEAAETTQLRTLLRAELEAAAGSARVALPPLISFDLDLEQDYALWVLRNETLSEGDRAEIARLDSELSYRPRFSFVMPTYNTPEALLRECLDSLLAQTYRDFDICIADDHSSDPSVVSILAEYAERDPRVNYVVRPRNGHISAASNSALSLARGDFVVLVDHDDLVPSYALFVVAWYLNRNPTADIIFSDEDKITVQGARLQPYFKGDFNKYLMYGHNMVSHLGIYRRLLVEEVGGFRLGLEGSQDYDLLLRCYEKSDDNRVIHIPHILYHWRISPGSTALSANQKSYAVLAAQQAINGHFERQAMPLRSTDGFAPGCTAVRPSRIDESPLSIVIPTRDGVEVLQPCIDSILARQHDSTEIIIIDNGSSNPSTLAYLSQLASERTARILRYDKPFNFSDMNNFAASKSDGRLLCFLNNDTEVISHDWLNRARTLLSISEVGAVGARLLFPNGMLQHFGIVLGMGMHGVAGTPHGGTDASLPGYFGKARLLQEVSAVTAACMFIRKSDFDALDGFESALSVAYNDVDLCLRLRQSGYRILVDPDISLTHKESQTRGSDKNGERASRLEQEANWMRIRWGVELANDPYYSPNHDLARFDFTMARRPRAAWPWRDTSITPTKEY